MISLQSWDTKQQQGVKIQVGSSSRHPDAVANVLANSQPIPCSADLSPAEF
jgi:hypothetical protein